MADKPEEKKPDSTPAEDGAPVALTVSDEEVLARIRKAYPHLIIEAGRDDMVRQGATYSYKQTEVSNSLDQLEIYQQSNSIHRDLEAARAIRDSNNEAFEQFWNNLNDQHPEWEEWGFWQEVYDIPGCIEEPDAPAVHAVIRRLRPEVFGDGPYPTVFCIPPGGLILNDPYICASAPMAKFLGAQLVTVQYRSNVDACYPAAINDLHAGYQWMVDHAEELNIDLDRIVIYGGSTGGMFSAAFPFRLKRYDWCGAPMPRGVIVDDGMLDDRGYRRCSRTKSYTWCGITDREANMLYMGDNFASPFVGPEAYANHATVSECVGLPPYAMYNGQDNPGSDYVLEFALKLAEANVHCSTLIWGSTTHSRPAREDNKLVMPFLNLSVADDGIYQPREGHDGAAIVENFIVGAAVDFLNLDLRRLNV